MIVKMLKEFWRRLDEQSEKLEVYNKFRKYKEPSRAAEYNN